MTPTTLGPPSARVVLVGRLGSRVRQRELPSGDLLTTFTVVVDRPPRAVTAVAVDAIPCQSLRAGVARRLAALEPGRRVRVEGHLRRRFWRAAGGLGSAVEVEVDRLRAECRSVRA